MEQTYKILRFYRDDDNRNGETVAWGLTKEEAMSHCKDPETSSSTATNPDAVRRTEQYGPWFDGWTEE